ncbi:MAG: glycoside hydrolase family 99-like domain-containing protein [Bacteroidota bacterium]
MKKEAVKFIAYYLPQYYPTPENDRWWGKGFTEWTSVGKAKPLYKKHQQPRVPADLGYYDLRLPEIRQEQAELAKMYNLGGFCYYHYWFGNGKQMLNRPVDEVIESGKPDFPFCFCWANQSWTGHWFGAGDKMLIKQEYPGDSDVKEHFKYLLTAFMDNRYIKFEGRPVFIILDICSLPDPARMASQLNDLAIRNGFPGLYLIAGNFIPDGWDPAANNFDAITDNTFGRTLNDATQKWKSLSSRIFFNRFTRFLIGKNMVFEKRNTVSMKQFMKYYKISDKNKVSSIPVAIPNWDNTPRALKNGIVIRDATPLFFKEQLEIAFDYVSESVNHPGIVFIKSWNEWAEGNYLEPDIETGHAYLQVIKDFYS